MILQRILFPDCRFCSDYEMYVRMADEPAHGSCLDAQKGEIALDAGRGLSLDTLFNAFSIEKWLKYTRLDNLRLTLRLSGAFRFHDSAGIFVFNLAAGRTADTDAAGDCRIGILSL